MPDLRFLMKAQYSGSHALVIGINEYKTASPLGFAVNDATEFNRVLIDQLGFHAANVTVLIDADATRVNIHRAYLQLTKDHVGLDDRVIVFFAGHGCTRGGYRGEVGYLVPYDGDLDDPSTLLRWDDLTRNADLIRAKHVLFIMDACYGGLALTRHMGAGSARFLRDMLLRTSRQVLTAGKADEQVADSGGPLPGHSVFTGHLLEGIRSKAYSEDGVLTANGLMAYVHSKVATDKNSNQTPHYGYIDGDGDFVLVGPRLFEPDQTGDTATDVLISIPVSADFDGETGSASDKLGQLKALLGPEARAIELHDFVVKEVRRLLASTSEDNFKVSVPYSRDEMLSRIARYEVLTRDLSRIAACLGYWGRPIHKPTFQKALSRLSDHLSACSGVSTYIFMRWLPSIIVLYSAGIAAVAGGRYDALAALFYAPSESTIDDVGSNTLAGNISEAILGLTRQEVFKHLPGHERHIVPLSEFLFTTLQPQLDDTLFLGAGYEGAFDEFEVLFALCVADLRLEAQHSAWAPLGRFSWKQRNAPRSPYNRLVIQARASLADWSPINAGLFGGKTERFERAVKEWGAKMGSGGP